MFGISESLIAFVASLFSSFLVVMNRDLVPYLVPNHLVEGK